MFIIQKKSITTCYKGTLPAPCNFNRPLAAWVKWPHFVLEIFTIMGYNLKNARNGKSASKQQDGQVWGPWH